MGKFFKRTSPIAGPVFIRGNIVHLAWRQYSVTLCGQPISRKDKLARIRAGRDKISMGSKICEECLNIQDVLEEEGYDTKSD